MQAKLIIFREDGSRRDFPLTRGATTIGRKNDCTIRIPLPEISRRHAEVLMEEESLVLRDLGAANGTFLNNRKIIEEDLEAGDQIMIGPVIFTVQIDGDPPDDEILQIKSKVRQSVHGAAQGGARVSASRHVSTADEEIDPIAALEALASSADQTAINPEDEQ